MIITCILLMPLKVNDHAHIILLFALLVAVKDVISHQRWQLILLIFIALFPILLYVTIQIMTNITPIKELYQYFNILFLLCGAIALNIYLGVALIHHKRLFRKTTRFKKTTERVFVEKTVAITPDTDAA